MESDYGNSGMEIVTCIMIIYLSISSVQKLFIWSVNIKIH